MNIPQTIYEQLGGQKFAAMVGSTRAIGGEASLTVRFKARAKQGINSVVVELDRATDLYTMVFYHVRGFKIAVRETRRNLFAADLQKVFTAVTGLDTHL